MKKYFEMLTVLVLSVAAVSMAAAVAYAQDQPGDGGGKDADEIARELANPNAVLGFLSFPIDYITYDGDLPGASSQSALKLSFQPSFPYPLGKDTNLFVRPLIPLLFDQPSPIAADQSDQPSSKVFEGSGTQLGDIGFDVAIGKSFSNRMVFFGGVVGTLPTATDDAVGLDQYLLGPEVYVGISPSWGHFGVLLTHQWDVAGEDSYDTSITGGQYFFTYNLKNAWQIQMAPTFSYNHNADGGQELTFPLGAGLSKTIVFGNTPWKFQLQYWEYLSAPDAFGPESQIRFTVTPVVPLPW